jgi:hypothetical protein
LLGLNPTAVERLRFVDSLAFILVAWPRNQELAYNFTAMPIAVDGVVHEIQRRGIDPVPGDFWRKYPQLRVRFVAIPVTAIPRQPNQHPKRAVKVGLANLTGLAITCEFELYLSIRVKCKEFFGARA